MKLYKSIAKISLVICSFCGFQAVAEHGNSTARDSTTTGVRLRSDSELKTLISNELDSLGEDLTSRVEFAIQDARIIAIGYVKDESQHDAVINAIKRVGGYSELIDEVEINGRPDAPVRDAVTTGKVKAYLMRPFNGVVSGDYAVTTVDGVVYIVGTAKSEEEKRRVVDYIKSLSNVNKVVSHIRVTY